MHTHSGAGPGGEQEYSNVQAVEGVYSDHFLDPVDVRHQRGQKSNQNTHSRLRQHFHIPELTI